MLNSDEALNVTMDVYCIWLNKWLEADDVSEHRYAPGQFEPATVKAIVPMWDYLYVFEVSDGDEGGPAELYAWIDNDGSLTHLMQGFDTNVQSIFDREKGFLNTP